MNLSTTSSTSSTSSTQNVTKKYDLIVIGSGPGGYIAAIRATQLGKQVALIERDKLGGVCLNRGCIPTKALIKSARAVHALSEMKELGINIDHNSISLDGLKALTRANAVADRVSKGVGHLMKKNKIDVISGHARFIDQKIIEVFNPTNNTNNESICTISATKIIIATGAKYKTFDGLTHDGVRLLGAWEALKLKSFPKSVAVIGAGAIGVEFSYFYNAFGAEVSIFEREPHLLPLEDSDTSLEIERAYKRYGIKLNLGLKGVRAKNCDTHVEVTFERAIDANANTEIKTENFDIALIAVGMTGNLNEIGLEKIGTGIKVDRGFIAADEFGRTNVEGIYAIGDVVGAPLLAHVASHQGIIAVEHMFGENPHPIKRENIPGCTYSVPEVASVGLSENFLKQNDIKYRVGKLPFIANGKAIASNEKDGMIKVLIDENDKLLGAHIVGEHATELLFEYMLIKEQNGSVKDIINTIHAHPTLGESLSEAILLAYNRSLNF
ncbi:MAG: dihydrolipoyl dehydrogenase [Oligoflexia bacterium]|nr:dihydrolipoyl dehydrogenase [Oligoflexia bacterium]